MKINDRGIWILDDPDRHVCSEELCEGIISIIKDLNVQSVIDMGCGNGAYVRAIQDAGIECDGCDGNPLTREITEGLCEPLDLSRPVALRKYDMVVSLEVGEHIPEEYESIFIDNLTSVADEFIVLSWAIPKQRGTGRVNCRSNEYIVEQMYNRNFKLTDHYIGLREAVVNKKFKYFRNTVLTFERAENE